jgi:hypothetical protein
VRPGEGKKQKPAVFDGVMGLHAHIVLMVTTNCRFRKGAQSDDIELDKKGRA